MKTRARLIVIAALFMLGAGTFVAGDLLNIKVVNSNAANATGVVTCGFRLNE